MTNLILLFTVIAMAAMVSAQEDESNSFISLAITQYLEAKKIIYHMGYIIIIYSI